MPEDGGIGYRRNGKKQACEPCRKGKLACDHGAPFCGRPPTAALSASSHSAIPQASSQTWLPSNVPLVSVPLVSPTTGLGTGLQALEVSVNDSEKSRTECRGRKERQPGEQPTRKNLDRWKTAEYPKSAKYYGPTSFSSVFSEHKTPDTDLLNIGEDSRRHPGSWLFGQPLLGRGRPNAPDIRRKEVVKALENIPSQEICGDLIARTTASEAIHNISMHPVLIKHCIATLWSTFGPQLAAPRTVEGLTVIAEVLFKNEETPLPESPEDGFEWLNTFMGPNLRLEMLGILFCFFGQAFLTLQDWDPLFKVPENHDRDRKETTWRMKECADICRKMCHFSETINELVAALTFSIHIVESCCTGDESYLLRHGHGDMVTSAINAGLHRLPDYTRTKVTTALEYKSRLFCAVYVLDKTIASLNGIPPMLTRLYCDVKPCLDLPEEELFLPPHELSDAVSRLDSNGWNTTGNMYSITISRAIWRLSAVREEILELALGVNVMVSEERIGELRLRCQGVLNSLPKQLLYYADGVDPKDKTGKTLFAQACLMQEFLQNIFLIERVATARGLPHENRLLDAAMEMLELTLMFWISRDKLQSFTAYFDWIITYHGIPSAGVICVNLLKSQTSNQPYSGFSRSDAIQKLTLFIGFLEWIRPTDGNYKLAGRLRKVIRGVLDHVLEPPAAGSGASLSIDTHFDPMLSPVSNLNDMDWLNTIDWTQGSWMEFN
ncbi:hypothetical protein G7Y89_g494 [Cudoniella acicularis]|uniref:Xylanolytic transcriptional activator regulatory domain-containing protein n=1 Tax=Cudoniella acicularis TaxID=354080 RepID=A0A8H4RZT9_9HELO|nr:hypothetical protein G7Y89_g494 [Cudoniella acicularis]